MNYKVMALSNTKRYMLWIKIILAADMILNYGCASHIDYHTYDQQIAEWQRLMKDDGPYQFQTVLEKLHRMPMNKIANPKKLIEYIKQLKEWNELIHEEGWSRHAVEKIIKGCRWIKKYKQYDPNDFWYTYYGFITAGFEGDCEDIANFFAGTLRVLGCPYKVRLIAYTYLIGDHADLKIYYEEDEKIYQTLPLPTNFIDRAFYKPLFEYDIDTVIYFSNQEGDN